MTEVTASAHDFAVRKFFVPDPGYVMADIDLSKADLHVVVWEANDAELKQQLREGVDVYGEAGSVVGMTDYSLCKRFIHLTDYGGKPSTLASACGITQHEAGVAQRRWFQAHPGILDWHERTRDLLQNKPARIWNRLGYHRLLFGRADDALFREALAWVPQSTVACVTNRGMVNIAEQCAWAQVLLQVHDSVLVQFPKEYFGRRSELQNSMRVVVPYEDPLVIPCGIKASDISWGDCQAVAWH